LYPSAGATLDDHSDANRTTHPHKGGAGLAEYKVSLHACNGTRVRLGNGLRRRPLRASKTVRLKRKGKNQSPQGLVCFQPTGTLLARGTQMAQIVQMNEGERGWCGGWECAVWLPHPWRYVFWSGIPCSFNSAHNITYKAGNYLGHVSSKKISAPVACASGPT